MNCKNCGAKLMEGEKFCKYCGSKIEENIQNNINVEPVKEVNEPIVLDKNENILLGTIGALIGSLAGAVIIILLGQLGFVASIAGVAMAYCTLYLYEKFAGKISKTGIIISILIMIIMTFLAENLLISINVSKALNLQTYTTWKVFTKFFDLMKYDIIDKSAYFTNLFMVYLFTLIGAIGTIKNKLNDIKLK